MGSAATLQLDLLLGAAGERRREALHDAVLGTAGAHRRGARALEAHAAVGVAHDERGARAGHRDRLRVDHAHGVLAHDLGDLVDAELGVILLGRLIGARRRADDEKRSNRKSDQKILEIHCR